MDHQTFSKALSHIHAQRRRGEISADTRRDAELTLVRQSAADRGATPAEVLRNVLALEGAA